jgi:hypothetical protein
MKLAVFGNRNINDKALINDTLNAFTVEKGVHYSVLLHGGAEGPQKIAAELADEVDLPAVLFKPWHMVWSNIVFDRTLFFMRNKQIIDNADEIIIFSNGEKDSEVSRVKDYCDKHSRSYTLVEVNN